MKYAVRAEDFAPPKNVEAMLFFGTLHIRSADLNTVFIQQYHFVGPASQ
jgi:hypothetical protein